MEANLSLRDLRDGNFKHRSQKLKVYAGLGEPRPRWRAVCCSCRDRVIILVTHTLIDTLRRKSSTWTPHGPVKRMHEINYHPQHGTIQDRSATLALLRGIMHSLGAVEYNIPLELSDPRQKAEPPIDLIQGLVRAKHELSTVLCPRLCHKTIAQLTYSSQNTQFRSIDRLAPLLPESRVLGDDLELETTPSSEVVSIEHQENI
ncbi:hypothetical protein ACRRTK_001257 [Alexandromys fortis]